MCSCPSPKAGAAAAALDEAELSICKGLTWIVTKADDAPWGDVLAQVMSLPKVVRTNIRLFEVGVGNRLAKCSFCDSPCNSVCPVLGELFAITWANLEKDGIQIS